MMRKTVYFVVGPTAVGKTSFAIDLAKYLETEIISADSRQFFKEMSIGTAKPSAEELKQVKHHFIGNLSIQQTYNVSDFEKDALQLLDQLFKLKDKVVVVGGSGLYLDALAYGIDELPDASDEVRDDLQQLYKAGGIEALQNKLKVLDSVFFEQVDQQNPKRLLRALEVCLMSGKPYSELRMGNKKKRNFNMHWIGLEQDRAVLSDRINRRVDQMLNDGLMDEVKALFPYKDLNALNTVGYKEFFQFLEEKESYEWAVEKVKTNSRRYAKRQMTWFRKNKSIVWFDTAYLPDFDSLLKHFE